MELGGAVLLDCGLNCRADSFWIDKQTGLMSRPERTVDCRTRSRSFYTIGEVPWSSDNFSE